jgi:hypothetical protein
VLLMGTLLFLSLRGLHVLLAAVWVGSMAFTSYHYIVRFAAVDSAEN